MSRNEIPADELAARRQAKLDPPVSEFDRLENLPDPYEGLNEFEKRKKWNEAKRETLEKYPWYSLAEDSSCSSDSMSILKSELERNYAAFALKMDFDKYPFPYGKTPEIEFLVQQYREANSPELKKQLYRKTRRAMIAHEGRVIAEQNK